MQAIIEYHLVGVVGSLELQGEVEGDLVKLFTVVDGVGYAFLTPPPETLMDYLGQGINALNPQLFPEALSFEQALEFLEEGAFRSDQFEREMDKISELNPPAKAWMDSIFGRINALNPQDFTAVASIAQGKEKSGEDGSLTDRFENDKRDGAENFESISEE